MFLKWREGKENAQRRYTAQNSRENIKVRNVKSIERGPANMPLRMMV